MALAQETIERLDWPLCDIYMHVTSEVERTLRVRACEKEPETVEWIRGFPEGSTFWDIGANVGSYSLIAGALGHRVYAFEPSLTNAARLQANILLNGLQNKVVVIPMLVGQKTGLQRFQLTSLEPGATHGDRYEGDEIYVLSMTGATLAGANLDYVKIDVDGAEMDVLLGFGDLLPRYGLLVEVSDDTSVPVCQLLETQGFVLRAWYPRSEPGIRNVIFDRRS